MVKKNRCKICRRVGQKLFLKGAKCFSPHCPFLKKPYPPGPQGKRRKGEPSEYKKELIEKQKLREWYNLSEKQFKNYVEEILAKRGKIEDAGLALVQKLEKRLDNVVYKLGFASSRREARQLVSHGHFLVNQKPVNIPSFQVKKGDVISVKEKDIKKPYFKKIAILIKEIEPPPWLKLDKQKLEGKVVGEPTLETAQVPVEISSVFEFYAK